MGGPAHLYMTPVINSAHKFMHACVKACINFNRSHKNNHSPAFYERLKRAAPEYEHHEEWLRQNGDEYGL